MARQYIRSNQSEEIRELARLTAMADIAKELKGLKMRNSKHNMMNVSSAHLLASPKRFFNECLNLAKEYSINLNNELIDK